MNIFINCLLYNILSVGALFFILKKNPRYMLQDYPKALQEKVTPKSDKEKKESFLFGLPFISILFLYPLLFGAYGKIILENSFIQNYLRIFVMIFSFNLIDLIFVDWFVFCTITPNLVVLPGTEKDPAYKNYLFHFRAFIKGVVFSIVSSIFIALLSEVIRLVAELFSMIKSL